MEFSNTFTVDVPLQRVWAFMIQPDKVAPCVPGAEIGEQLGEGRFSGSIKVKLGPVNMTFRGEMEMSPDESTHTITLSGKGRDIRGGGTASGTLVARLGESAGATTVDVQSTVDVAGRVAQFGRGLIPDVAASLIREFSRRLESRLQADPDGADAPDPAESEPDALSLTQVARDVVKSRVGRVHWPGRNSDETPSRD